MKILIPRLVILVILFSFISCKKDDSVSFTPPRDYGEQYANEIIEIEEYLDTHYLQGEGLNAKVIKIPEGGTQTPISQLPPETLKQKIVNKHDIEYKLYYINFNEGTNHRPSHVDSVFVTYRGWLTDGTQFDYAPNPIWLTLDNVIEGWTQVFPEFKTGTYNEGSNIFENTGSGIMFVPSGLGYYNSGSASIPAYSTLVFSFNLNTLRYRDHDKDGILSYLEVENIDDDPRKYDTDNDGTPNYLDIDDDNDGKITRGEITDPDGNIYSFDLIPVCASGKKIHIDPDLSCNE